MNQKIINIILALGLVISVFLQFREIQPSTSSQKENSTASNKAIKLAYVDLDSIQSQYVYYKEKMTEFEKKKESADRDLNNAFQKIESERIAFAKRGESITQSEYENFQRSYQSKMQNLEQQKRVLETSIATDGEQAMNDLKKKINDFLGEYNKVHGYSYIFSYSNAVNVLFYKDTTYDITKEVIQGLNAAHSKTSSKK